MKNLLRLIFIITMGILLTGGECGKKVEPVIQEEPPAKKEDPPKNKEEPPKKKVDPPKKVDPVEREESVPA